MEDGYQKEKPIIERTEDEKDLELMKSIIRTKKEIEVANRNYEFAEDGLVDYYIYQIKANQAKLDYLVKKAKIRGLVVPNGVEKAIQLEIIEDVG